MKITLTGDVADREIAPEYRPVPFWSWNDELDPDELRRQIRLMHDAGIGGFFIHARGGLKTPYMGCKWMEMVSVCVREARRLGMNPWLYDENGWPSGFGNGKVNGLGEAYQQKYLRFGAQLPEDGRLLAKYDAALRPLSPEAPDFAFAAWYEINPYYVDNMDPDVVAEFIRQVHEVYWRKLPGDVRAGLVGIFTDEPALSRNGIPYSAKLFPAYREKYGEDLVERLPELFRECGDYRKTRIRFWRLVTELFRAAYFDRIGAWCEAHDWELTGHQLLEESYDAMLSSNGAVMPLYTRYSIPGNDHLGRYSARPVADAQLVSAAAQFGRRQTLTETFGCCGWNFNIRGMKWLFQQQLAHGVNLLCSHLEGYSLRGMRKRDYPPSVFYQHPMWPHIRPLHDAFARVGRMLALGEDECELLVLHGQSTAWMDSRGYMGEAATVNDYLPFMRLSGALERSGYPFHYGDEIILSESAAAEHGGLRVGRKRYTTVLIPPLKNLAASTLKLLRAFRAGGGTILRFTAPDMVLEYVDGEPLADADREFLASLPETGDFDELTAQLAAAGARSLRCSCLNGCDGRVRGTWRRFPDRRERWYFLADFNSMPENTAVEDFYHDEVTDFGGPDTPAALEITLPFAARKIKVIDPVTGAVERELSFLNTPGGGCRFLHTLDAENSLFLCAEDLPDPTAGLPLNDRWHVELPYNVLTLDRAAFRTAKGAWSEELDTLAIFHRMLALGKDSPLELRYRFTLRPELAGAALSMALETAPRAEYFVNDHPLAPECRTEGFFLDRAFEIWRLPSPALRVGENVFTVRTRFHQTPKIRAALERAKHFEGEANKLFFDSEVEAVYLLGDFGVFFPNVEPERPGCRVLSGRPELGTLPETVSAGDLVRGGLPFFSGELRLHREFELTEAQAARFSVLKFAPFLANSVRVVLNERDFPEMVGAPFETEVAGNLRPGKNTLELILTTSCRNTLGPLHMTPVEPRAVGPTAFLTEPDVLGNPPRSKSENYGVLEYGPENVILF